MIIFLIGYGVVEALEPLEANAGGIKSRKLQCKLSTIGVSVDYIEELEFGLMLCGVPENLVLSIIQVESRFVVSAYNAYSGDYGLMQINKFHVKADKLDEELLLSSVVYNLLAGCKVLRWFVSRYELDEAIMRYNVGTTKSAVQSEAAKAYLRSVKRWYDELESE